MGDTAEQAWADGIGRVTITQPSGNVVVVGLQGSVRKDLALQLADRLDDLLELVAARQEMFFNVALLHGTCGELGAGIARVLLGRRDHVGSLHALAGPQTEATCIPAVQRALGSGSTYVEAVLFDAAIRRAVSG